MELFVNFGLGMLYNFAKSLVKQIGIPHYCGGFLSNITKLLILFPLCIVFSCRADNIGEIEYKEVVFDVSFVNGVGFYYNHFGKMLVDVSVAKGKTDTADLSKNTCTLFFDTGGAGILVLRDSIADSIDSLWRQKSQKGEVFSGWDALYEYDYYRVKTSVVLFLGEHEVHYDDFYVYSSAAEKVDNDGFFSIPIKDERVWELNFDHNYLTIKDSSQFINKSNVVSTYLKDSVRHLYALQFPLSFVSEQGDTINIKEDLLLDTGSQLSLVYKYVPFVGDRDSLCQRYNLPYDEQRELNCFLVDFCKPFENKTWVETRYYKLKYSLPWSRPMIIAGVDFLKHFNIEIDKKHAFVHFLPIKKEYFSAYAERQKEKSGIIFRALRDRFNNAIIYEADPQTYNYKGDYLRVGDVIIDVDGEKLHRRPYTYFETIEQDSKITAIRGKDTITITIAKPEKTIDSLSTN